MERRDIPQLKVKCMSNYILHIDDVPKRVTNDRDMIENIIGYRSLSIVEIKEQKNLCQEIDYIIKCKSLTLKDIQSKQNTFKMEKDLVEVIRCKQCKYFTNNIGDYSLRNGYCNRKEVGSFCKVKDDGTDYCSYAISK